VDETKPRILNAVRSVPGTLQEPGPEALILNLGDSGSQLTMRILWWTKASRQHQMLASYDAVLAAIWQTMHRTTGQQEGASRPAA